ncbi:hypothetical protein DL95DRAFT_316507 [Leptodontidium sp. 2 PMI_412]|nr:hypothetical protein DL95DRAFT_316507 [Leptodontidium sp. 2 PMI_412]
MDSSAELESCSNELAIAVKSLVAYFRTNKGVQNGSYMPFIDPEASPEVQKAKQSVLSNVAKIRMLVYAPADFLKHLASQGGILGCLRWLGEFQILACIPLTGSVPITDIASLSGVDERQLSRTIRLVASSGFLQLQEIRPVVQVAHTALSAAFVTNPSLLDATMFLAECATPAGLQTHTQPDTGSNLIQTQTPLPMHMATASPKLRRQQSAYLTHAGGLDAEESVVESLGQLNWSNVSTSTGVHAVEVGCTSATIAQGLTALNPALRFHMQLDAGAGPGPESRITISHRELGVGSPQTVTDAAVYILHLPDAQAAVLAELREHMAVLRSGNGVMLILTAHLLPEPGSIPDPDTEAATRARDLAWRHLSLTTAGEMEMLELLEMIEMVSDSWGKLVVINKIRSRSNVVVALAIKYVDHGLGLWSGTGGEANRQLQHGVGTDRGLGGLAAENPL